MSDAGRTQRQPGTDGAQEEVTEAPERDAARDVVDDVDELLDEIDEVLEENAEEFVRGYVQKGGQ
ncbi:MAG: ubiquitin-like protein Pup [Nitriliruptoraceae bacterium]